MKCKDIAKEVRNLLYWTMLAATTVGPGTVITCARAGAEYQMHLIWALIFGSVLGFTLQEGTARLTIVSAKSIGECLQLKYSDKKSVWNVGIICWVVTVLVFIGNTLYQCNNFAGGMAAVFALPHVEETSVIRASTCVVYAIIVITILYFDKVDSLGVSLGVVTVSMVILFLILVIKLGLDGVRFAKGLIPMSMPNGSINIVLSLIGTTSIGYTLFLGGEMAKDQNLTRAQCGIAFSTCMAFAISVLILIVGDANYESSKGIFTIASLFDFIERLTGTFGTWLFGIGFIAAALSSMLTTPLGSAMTADSLLTINIPDEAGKGSSSEFNESNIPCEEYTVPVPSSKCRKFPKKYYLAMMFVMVIISAVVIAVNTPRLLIILIAQVFNGCLLPLFSTCLLICINDPQFMGRAPQKGWANCCLIIVVWITFFLTSNTIIQNILGWTISKHYISIDTFQHCNLISSAILSFVIIVLVSWLTDLGKNLKRSFSFC